MKSIATHLACIEALDEDRRRRARSASTMTGPVMIALFGLGMLVSAYLLEQLALDRLMGRFGP